LRVALGWALDTGRSQEAARLALALWRFWHTRTYQREGVRWLERIQELDVATPLPPAFRPRLLNALGVLYHSLCQFDRATSYHAEALRIWIISVFPFDTPADSPFSVGNWPPVFLAALFLLTWGNGLGVQIYRYLFVSRPEQRQQTKWFVFACTIAIVLLILYIAIQGLVPAFNQPDSLYKLAYATVIVLVFLAIPLALGIAILRYRLWDIDILIRRPLVYGTLTVILTAVYVGLFISLQALLRGLISQDNSVAIVLSTLIIIVLFRSLHQRIQQLIDRRFYRSKYDAAKVVAAFNATLRREVNLDLLNKQLVSVVEETMQPTHVSLWLVRREQHIFQIPVDSD
jgi:hypothetical protein